MTHPTLESYREPYAAILGATDICPIGHQGLYQDKETDTTHNRARTLRPRDGRFNQTDPRRYVDGMNLYQECRSAPIGRTDPFGTSSGDDATSLLRNEQILHSGHTYYREAGVDKTFDHLWWALGKVEVAYMVLGQLGSSEAFYMPVYDLIKIRRGTTDSRTIVHELVHALDDKKDWYITAWTAEEPAEALAYGTEYLLAAADGPLACLDNPALVRDCRKARRFWEAGWRQINNVLSQEIHWGTWRSKRRTLKGADIVDISAKLGMRVSCLKLKPVYEKMLADRGIQHDATSDLISLGPSDMVRGTVICPCWLTCDFTGFALDPVFK